MDKTEINIYWTQRIKVFSIHVSPAELELLEEKIFAFTKEMHIKHGNFPIVKQSGGFISVKWNEKHETKTEIKSEKSDGEWPRDSKGNFKAIDENNNPVNLV